MLTLSTDTASSESPVSGRLSRFRCLNPLEAAGWDEQVMLFPGATIFHSASWAQVLHETYGYRPMYIVAEQDGAMTGVLPLMEVHSAFTGSRGVSLPFTDFCPALGEDSETIDRLYAEAVRLAGTHHWQYVEVRGGREVSGSDPDSTSRISHPASSPSHSAQHISYEHTLCLSPENGAQHSTGNAQRPRKEIRDLDVGRSELDPPSQSNGGQVVGRSDSGDRKTSTPPGAVADPLFASFHSSTRRAIRKAEKAGLDITIDSALGSVKAFYRLNALTRRGHGLPPQPFSFFHNLHRAILARDHGFVVTAWLEQRPVAAAVFLHFADSATYKFGASDERHHDTRANNLVMWSGIEECRRIGLTYLSLGKTRLANDGLRRYKQGWGTIEHERAYIRLDGVTGDLISWEDKVVGLHNEVFGRLPLPISRLAGKLLYRHMA